MPNPLTLQSASLKGFLAHRDTTLSFTPGITNIVGRFGYGKSAIPEAIRWTVEGTSPRSVPFDPAIGGGFPCPCRVELTFLVGDEPLTVYRTPSGFSHTKQGIYEILGIRESSRTAKDDLTLLDVAMNPQRFFEVSADARLRFIDRTFGAPITTGELESRGITEEVLRASLKSLKAGVAKAESLRRDAERMAENTVAASPKDEEVVINGSRKRLSFIVEGELRAQVKAAKDSRDIQKQKAADIRAAAKVASALPDAEAAVKKADAALKTAQDAHKAHVMGDRAKVRATAEETASAAETSLVQVKGAIAALTGKADPCPTCGTDKNIKQLLLLKDDLAKFTAALSDAKATMTDYATMASTLKADADRARKALTDATAALTRAQAVKPVDPSTAEPFDKKAAAMEVVIQEAEAALAKATVYHGGIRAIEEATKRKQTFLEEAARYRSMEGALGKLIDDRGTGPLPLLIEKVKNLSAKLDFPCALTTDAEVLVKEGAIEQASRGQKFFAGIVIGTAIVTVSGLGFLWLDDMASVDAWARLRLFRMLRALTTGDAPQLRQVFLLSMADMTRYCPKCGKMRLSKEDSTCSDCGTPTALKAPPKDGGYRLYEFKGVGVVEEVRW